MFNKIKILIVLAMSAIFLASCAPSLYKVGEKKCGPVYGNWCGENYPLAGFNPPAVDNWDRACRAHDHCYESGEPKKSCDKAFVSEVERLAEEQMVPQEMMNAHAWFREGSMFKTDNQRFIPSGTDFPSGAITPPEVHTLHQAWGIIASCQGGDGAAAQFKCFVNSSVSCPIDPRSRPGKLGMTCSCSNIDEPGVIVRRFFIMGVECVEANEYCRK